MTSENHTRFSTLALRTELLQALNAVNYIDLSPIQSASADAVIKRQDLLAQAETGSGKTVAFAMGILNKLELTRFQTQALVICPTRELADQVATEIRRLASAMANTRVLTLCGGKPLHDQLTSLKRAPHIVVGTPGRLKKHLEKNTLDLDGIETLVLDEADRMLDMGFFDDIMHILNRTPKDRQTMMFSATYPEEILDISRLIQRDPVDVRVAGSNAVDKIEQLFVLSSDKDKPETLFRVMGKYPMPSAIIFCNRKSQVQDVCDALKAQGIRAGALHGDLDQRERDEAIILFANKSIAFLVATDVAARGLDINELSAVINYDLTPDPETYLHRIGRTGRAGLEGLAISLVGKDEMHRVSGIEEYLENKARFVELTHADRNDGNAANPLTRTIQIGAGKKDKIRAGDIVGALTADSSLTNDHIGKITVQAKVSFVAIDFAKAKTALDILTNGRIKKQRVRVRLIG